jgi:hypothetical protein
MFNKNYLLLSFNMEKENRILEQITRHQDQLKSSCGLVLHTDRCTIIGGVST